MKKAYINPATQVVLVEATLMQNASLQLNNNEDDAIESSEAILSRRSNSIWDDDEE